MDGAMQLFIHFIANIAWLLFLLSRGEIQKIVSITKIYFSSELHMYLLCVYIY